MQGIRTMRYCNRSNILLLLMFLICLLCCIAGKESLFAFGTYSYGEYGISDNIPIIPYPLDKPFPFQIKDIAIGNNHVMFLTTGGDVYSIGSNDKGQFGNGEVTGAFSGIPSKFQNPPINGTIVAISTMIYNSFVLTSTGEVYGCGGNTYGEIGNGGFGIDISIPVRVFSNLNITEIQSGNQITTVLTNTKELYSVGSNIKFQFGNNSLSTAHVPTKASLDPVNRYKVCDSYTIAETENNKFYIFGTFASNLYQIPTSITGLDGLNITDFRCGGTNRVFFLTVSGEIYYLFSSLTATKRNDLNGKVVRLLTDNFKILTEDDLLYRIDTTPATPISLKFIKSNTRIEKIFTSRLASNILQYYLTNDTSLYLSIADSSNNRLGFSGTSFGFYPLNITAYHPYSPYSIIKASKIISANVFVSNSNTVYTTGSNENSLLGTGIPSTNLKFAYSPINVSNDTFKEKEIKDVSMGGYHTLILTRNGEVYAFGDNRDGAFCNGGTQTDQTIQRIVPSLNVSAISAGFGYSLFLTNTGEVYSCGRGASGQLGNGIAADNSTLTKVLNLDGKNISSIHAGNLDSFVLTTEGEVYGFGYNYQNMIGAKSSVPVKVTIAGNPKIVKISHSTNNAAFLTDTGVVKIKGSVSLLFNFAINGKYIKDIAVSNIQFYFITDNGELYSTGTNNVGELGLGLVSAGFGGTYRIPLYYKAISVSPGQSHVVVKVSDSEPLCDGVDNCSDITIHGKLEGTEKITTFSISVDLTSSIVNTSSILFNYYIPNVFNNNSESSNFNFKIQTKGRYELTITLYAKDRRDFIHGNKTVIIDVLEFNSNSIADDLSLNDLIDITKNSYFFNNQNKTQIVSQLVTLVTKENVKSVEQGKKVIQIYESMTEYADIPISVNVTSQISQISNVILQSKKNNNITDSEIDTSVTSIINVLDNILQQTTNNANKSDISSSKEIKRDTEQTIQTSFSLLSLSSSIANKRIEGKAMNLLFTRVSPTTQETSLNVTSGYQFIIPNNNNNIGLSSNESNISYGAVKISDSLLYQTSEIQLSNVFQLKTFVNGSYIPLRNLEKPIFISFKLEKLAITFNSSISYSCKYFNESLQEWRSDGCKSTGINILRDNSVVMNCECDHTTSFLTFLEFSSKSNETSIAQIILSSIYLAIIIVIFIGLLIFRNEPIVKSRFLTPFIGLTAIFVDNLFSGIISNAIFQQTKISTTISTVDILGNVAVIISTMMTLIAIGTYFIETIRYLLVRYLYELLNENPKIERKPLLKIFTSKLIYITLCLFIGIPVIIYFVLFVLLRRFDKISAFTFSSITSITYFVLIIIFSITILSIYIFDIYFTKKYKQYTNELLEMINKRVDNNNNSTDNSKKKKIISNKNYQNVLKNFFVYNDTLLFRSEACIFLFGLIFFIISFCIGFSLLAKENQKEQQQLSKVILAFDLIRTILWIALFGGYILSVLIYKKCKAFLLKKDKKLSRDEKKNNEENNEEELGVILKQQEVFSLFKQYAKQEFSIENIYAFVDLEYIKELHNKKQQQELIWNELERFKIKYLETNANMELNVSYDLKKSVNICLKERKDLNDLIEEIEKSLIINLGDTYSRFIETDEYLLIERTRELKEQLTK
ncbi:hypothetical protein ABK040_014804 [Willaertia magna]